MALNKHERHLHWVENRVVREHEEMLKLEKMSRDFIDSIVQHNKTSNPVGQFDTGYKYDDSDCPIVLGDIVEVGKCGESYKGIIVDCVRVPADWFHNQEETICVKVRDQGGHELWDSIGWLTRIQGSKAIVLDDLFETVHLREILSEHLMRLRQCDDGGTDLD